MILLGLLLGLSLALAVVFLHGYRLYRSRFARLRMLTGQLAHEYRTNLDRAAALLAALELPPAAFAAAKLPYPAFATELARYVLAIPSAELLPDTLATRTAGCLTDIRAFNDLYTRVYFTLGEQTLRMSVGERET